MPSTSKVQRVRAPSQSPLSGMLWVEQNGGCGLVSVVMVTCYIYRCHILIGREAWSVCGKMSADLAMQMYIQELQQVCERSHVIVV